MSATTFNPLEAAQDLEAAGIERKHAEAIARAINRGDERAVTKADLDTAIAGVRSEITSVRSELATIRWVVGIQSAVTLATFAIVAAKLL